MTRTSMAAHPAVAWLGPTDRAGRPQRMRSANPAACNAASWRRWAWQTNRNTWSGSVQTCPEAGHGR
jgi:hypothetical protein